MNKWILALIIGIAVVVGLFVTYVLYAPVREWMDVTFQGAIPWITMQCDYAWAFFTGLPYWPLLLAIGFTLVGILIDRRAHWVWDRIQWGTKGDPRKRLQGLPPLQEAPASSLPQQIYPNPDLQQVPPQLEEEQPA